MGRSEIGSAMDKFQLSSLAVHQQRKRNGWEFTKPCWELLKWCSQRNQKFFKRNIPNRILSPILGLLYIQNCDNSHLNVFQPPSTSRPLEKSAAQSLNEEFRVENLSRFTSLGLSYRRNSTFVLRSQYLKSFNAKWDFLFLLLWCFIFFVSEIIFMPQRNEKFIANEKLLSSQAERKCWQQKVRLEEERKNFA